MSGRVVLVGELDLVQDAHKSVVGKMPGYLMQANFIEALLDDRYYRSMPVLDYVYGFIFLAALELILILWREHWMLMMVLIIVLLGLSVVGLYLTLKLARWYVNPVPVGLAAVTVRILGALFHRVEEQFNHPSAKTSVTNSREPKS
jgi:CHASE2 domain-containing sensor protein